MAELYDNTVCAIEPNIEFQGKSHFVPGLKYLFGAIEFVSFDGELVAAGESGDIIWAYVLYAKTSMKSKENGQNWDSLNTRCTYIFKKSKDELKILQNHCSQAVVYK